MLDTAIKACGLPVSLAGTALSGREAIQLIEDVRPQIVLLDIQMDGMNGLELASSLQDRLDYRPRIIYVTAYGRLDYARQAIRLGAVDYILKPIDPAEVKTALARAINQIQAERIREEERRRLEAHLQSAFPKLIADAPAPVETRSARVARAVREYVEQNYAEHISLATAAEHVRLSASYLGPLFKAECGMSFRSYLRMYRVARAKELMQDQRLNLTEIARAVGFQDENYFSQVFLEVTGVRPAEYRGGGSRWARSD